MNEMRPFAVPRSRQFVARPAESPTEHETAFYRYSWAILNAPGGRLMAKDAIELLKDDHDKVRDLLSQLAETSERATKSRHDLLRTIQAELEAHTTIEEEIFYPAFKKAGAEKKDDKLFYEAKEEHRTVDKLVLPDLSGTDVDTVEFAGRAKVLKELVEHHADEEEKEMFPRAKKLLSKDQLVELASRMEQRKEQLLKATA
jgi:hemerythrin-like domain-containing protein